MSSFDITSYAKSVLKNLNESIGKTDRDEARKKFDQLNKSNDDDDALLNNPLRRPFVVDVSDADKFVETYQNARKELDAMDLVVEELQKTGYNSIKDTPTLKKQRELINRIVKMSDTMKDSESVKYLKIRGDLLDTIVKSNEDSTSYIEKTLGSESISESYKKDLLERKEVFDSNAFLGASYKPKKEG